MHTKKGVIKKAILFEATQLLKNEDKENKRNLKAEIFDDVVDFYVGVREQFKHEILIKYEPQLNTNDFTYDDIKKWLIENNIAHYFNGVVTPSMATMDRCYSFWFVSSEDATACKLKWSS